MQVLRHCMGLWASKHLQLIKTQQWKHMFRQFINQAWSPARFLLVFYSYSVVGKTQRKQETNFGKFIQSDEFELDDKWRCGKWKEIEEQQMQKLFEEDVTVSTPELAWRLNIDHSSGLKAMGKIMKINLSSTCTSREKYPLKSLHLYNRCFRPLFQDAWSCLKLSMLNILLSNWWN